MARKKLAIEEAPPARAPGEALPRPESLEPAVVPSQVVPFLKWAGGKRKVAARIVSEMPEALPVGATYRELFLGGGAVFLHVAQRRESYRHARLADGCLEVAEAWLAVRDHVDALCDLLAAMAQDTSLAAYMAVREEPEPRKELVGRAARTIYLNRLSFNGLHRLNSKGKFNVPWGKYDKPSFDLENLQRVSKLLQDAEIACDDFERQLDEAQEGDVVYLDPPYMPRADDKPAFVGYASHGFRYFDQERLAGAFGRACNRGARCLLSQSATPKSRELYVAQHRVFSIRSSSSISYKASGRGTVEDLLVVGITTT